MFSLIREDVVDGWRFRFQREQDLIFLEINLQKIVDPLGIFGSMRYLFYLKPSLTFYETCESLKPSEKRFAIFSFPKTCNQAARLGVHASAGGC